MKHDELTFDSAGAACSAWHFTGEGSALATDSGRPVVVMAHGLGGTKDSGLAPFAEGLARAGLDVLAFDYRGFGTSEGTPRQRVRLEDQVADYRAAVEAARRLPGVDPARVVLWGVSLSGGHVLRVAAEREDVVAVVSMTPIVDGRAAARHALKHHSPGSMARAAADGLRSRVSARRGAGSVTMPIVAPPGRPGAMTLDGALESYLSIAGPTWVNEIDADVSFELGTRAPAKAAKQLTCPVLVQIADFDRSAPPHAAAKVAFSARAHVHHYPCDHFDVWPGQEWHETALRHQVAFLTRATAR
ncbi:alpha/beta hydrolase [Nocardioides acrostichi]|uniref:Alpha/beta fold hydrolase n=1 Tax=Nocardioides acrostichi TaxID=2784339 RepID=A0A930Y7P4_9ACTN|nr:alpha/beta fold hydrolase [Nocardioides acrostichi]MBF4162247.1 alpha/beta fold hydrolase [Nocardioides acrostichi]